MYDGSSIYCHKCGRSDDGTYYFEMRLDDGKPQTLCAACRDKEMMLLGIPEKKQRAPWQLEVIFWLLVLLVGLIILKNALNLLYP